MSTQVRGVSMADSSVHQRTISPSGDSMLSSIVDLSKARMRILVAPYFSPYVVSVEKVQNWESLITTLQRLFGRTFCSLTSPPKMTIHQSDIVVSRKNWESLVGPECCIVVHTKSEETCSAQVWTSISAIPEDSTKEARPRTRDGEISTPTPTTRDPRARLINKHANSGFETPNIFDERNFTPGTSDEAALSGESKTKRKRKGSLWETVMSVFSSHSHHSSQKKLATAQPIMGPVTHIAAMERVSSKKRRDDRKKRQSRVIGSGNPGRPVSMVKSPLSSKPSSGNIMRVPKGRTLEKPNKKASQPEKLVKPVRRHIARSHSDCSSCFTDDDKRESVVLPNRQARPTISTPKSSTSSATSIDTKRVVTPIDLKAGEVNVVTNAMLEDAIRRARPTSTACATITSSIYYDPTPPPVPKRQSEFTGFNSQYKCLDEEIIRSAANKVVAERKAEEVAVQIARRASQAPQRSSSLGPAQATRRYTGLRRSDTTTTGGRSTFRSPSRVVSIDASDKPNNAYLSRTGTVHMTESRSNSALGFRRQSTPYDNKPLPKLPNGADTSVSVHISATGSPLSTSPAGGVLMPPIATFEDLISMSKSESISEVAEICEVTHLRIVAG